MRITNNEIRFFIRYCFRFWGTLTNKKISNFLLLLLQYYFSILKKRSFLSAKPFFVSVEPTNICNLRCPECLTGNGKLQRKKGKITQKLYQGIVDRLSDKLCYLLLYFQGEPFIHDEFLDLVRYGKSKGLFVATSTNGQFLTKQNAEKIVFSGLDFITVSMDGVSQDVYSLYRKGGSIEKVKNGIQNLIRARKSLNSHFPLIELQFIVFRHNESEIQKFRSFAKELEVDKITLKSAQIYQLETNKEILPPKNSRYSRYKKDESGIYRFSGKRRRFCWRQWSGAVITWEGDFAPCCFDKDAEYAYGNVLTSDVVSLWRNKAAQQFRENILRDKNLPDICRNCLQ